MYGVELRKHVLKLIKNGQSQSEVAKSLSIPLRTIQRWLHDVKTGLGIEPRNHVPRQRKLDKEGVQLYLRDHPDATLKEMGKHFGVNHTSIWHLLKKAKITLKKN